MDLAWTDSQWISFFEKFGIPMSLFHFLWDFYILLRSKKTWVLTMNDINEDFYDWILEGVVLGDNTDSDGKIYIDIQVLYGGNTVSLYKDAARLNPDLVAQGTGAGGYPQTITLAEFNNSGLSGEVKLNAGLVSSDVFLVVSQGLLAQIDNLGGEDDFDAQIKADMQSVLALLASDMLSAMGRVRGVVSTYLLSRFATSKIKTTENSVEYPEASAGTGGTVAITLSGVFKYFLDAMEDNTPNSQLFVENNIGSGVPIEDPDNTGEGIYSGLTPRQNGKNGTITFECTDATFGSESFSVTMVTDRGLRFEADVELTVEKIYRSVELGIAEFTIARKVTEFFEPLGAFSNYMVVGASETNTNYGNIYLEWTGGTLSAYSDAARTALVAQTALVNGAAGPYTLVPQNDSGLSIDLVYDGTVMGDPYQFQISVKPFVLGDKIYLDTSNDFAGKISTFFGRNYKQELPNCPSPFETIPDGVGSRGFGVGFGEEAS